MQDTILILGSGDAAALVAHTLRWREVYSTILPPDSSMELLASLAPRGIVVVGQNAIQQLDRELFDSGLPLLCLDDAALELCAHYGGSQAPLKEERDLTLTPLNGDLLLDGFSNEEGRFFHFAPFALPQCLVPAALAGEDCIAFRHADKPHYGVQYPIERHDPDGAQLLSNFAREICGCNGVWNTDTIIDDCLDVIRTSAEDYDQIVCAVSGGVDSAVCAKLASLAAGDRLHCIFIDTGFFHKDEPQTIISDFQEHMGITVKYLDARQRFLAALSGISREQEKDAAVSTLLRQLLLGEVASFEGKTAVLLGTNLNDLLENSAAGPDADVAAYRVVEPLRKLFKTEVRSLAKALQLPASFAGRQPFPAAGLASRIFGTVTEERLSVLRLAGECFTKEILENGFDRKLRKYYAVLLQSPENPDAYTISLRALQAGRTNASARLPLDLLERVTARILQEVHGVSRVVYDLTPSQSFGEME